MVCLLQYIPLYKNASGSNSVSPSRSALMCTLGVSSIASRFSTVVLCSVRLSVHDQQMATARTQNQQQNPPSAAGAAAASTANRMAKKADFILNGGGALVFWESLILGRRSWYIEKLE